MITLHPETGKPVKIPSRGWMTGDSNKMMQWIEEDRVHFGEDENSVPCIKAYLTDRELQTPYSVFYQDGRAASKRLRALMGADYFDFPKDELVIQELVEMLTSADDTVIDFFAGSSTTAHSVLAQNAKDGGNRHFVVVQLPELTDEKSIAYKDGYRTISEISKERIRRAGAKILEENPDAKGKLDIGFRVLKIDSSNIADVRRTAKDTTQNDLLTLVENIKSDRTAEDLLFQVLLNWGVDLTLPIERELMAGKSIYFVAEDALAACFDRGIDEALVKEIAARAPLRAVFRDDAFKDDSTRINVEQLFKQLSPATELRVI